MRTRERVASYRCGERPQEKATQLTPFSWTFGLQNREENCEINSFLLFRPPTLQCFVRAVLADEQQAPCKLSHHFPSCLLRGLGKGQPSSDTKGGHSSPRTPPPPHMFAVAPHIPQPEKGPAAARLQHFITVIKALQLPPPASHSPTLA